MENDEKIYIKISLEEYKELLIIKGKYEELQKIHQPLIVWDGRKEDGTTILPYRDLQTTDPLITPPYKITCASTKSNSKHYVEAKNENIG